MKRWILLISLLTLTFASAFTTTLVTSVPGNGDDPRDTAMYIRDTKNAYQERLDVDHYFYPSAANTYDDADTGKHRYVTIKEPNSIASVNPDEFVLFTKDVNSIAELHWRDESENERQVSSEGLFLLDQQDLTLDNNSYLLATDNAGTGTVNVIKATTGDELQLGAVTTLPDGSKLATSADPNADAEIACKKYVDDSVAFGARTTTDTDSAALVKDTVYQAQCDGYLMVSGGALKTLLIKADNSSPPTTTVANGGNYNEDVSDDYLIYPASANEYLKIESSGTPSMIAWKPIGTGGLEK